MALPKLSDLKARAARWLGLTAPTPAPACTTAVRADRFDEMTWAEKMERKLERKVKRRVEKQLLEKGLEKGTEALRQTAIDLCEQRFGHDERGLEQIRRVKEPDLLSKLIVRLGTAASLPEALAALP